MTFYQLFAYFAAGVPIKRKLWDGYWKYDPVTNTITMYLKDGSVLPFVETPDILYTISNIITDDWEIATEDKCTVVVH